jgi:serine/threonine-protein kinase
VSADGDELLGAVLDGRYRVVEPIGHGAMGVVYRGERMHLGRTVAIKVLHDSLPNELAARQRFELEARAMARLEHPHCVAVLDVGMHDGRPYVVMEMVSGESLRHVLDRGPLDVARATSITRQILSGLGHAHELGIVHRDIKPANLMLGQKTGLGDHVKILDFGLARSLDSGSARLTTGIVLGTPAYMSPEQARDASVDARSDLYAVGVVLFEMLTGRKPFVSTKDDPIEIVGMHIHKPPPRLVDALPSGDFAALEPVLSRALAKAPDDRYRNAAELAEAIESAVRGDTVPIERFDASELDIPVAKPDAVPEAPIIMSPSLSIEAAALARAAPVAAPPAAAVAVAAPVPVPGPEPAPRVATVARPVAPPVAPVVETESPRADATEPVQRIAPPPRWAYYAAAAAGVVALLIIVRHCASGSRTSPSVAPLDATPAVAMIDAHAATPAPRPDAAPTAAVPPDAADVEPPIDDPAGRALYDANHRVAAGDIDGALHILATAHAAYSANPDIPYMAGRLYFQKQRYHDGISSLRAAVDLFPGYQDDPNLAKLVVDAFLATPTRNAEIAKFLHDIRATALPLLRDAAATNPRAQAELGHL